MKRALLIIDYSNDFIDDKGALTCGDAGQSLDDPILEQINATLDNDDFVFVCNDQHQEDDAYDPEALLFPPHNLEGSWGAELYGASGRLLQALLREGHPNVRFLGKQRYSAFFGTPLDMMLRARNVEHLTVVGVCTDICVLHTVIDACYLGYMVTVPREACTTITPNGQDWAINHMRDCLSVEVL